MLKSSLTYYEIVYPSFKDDLKPLDLSELRLLIDINFYHYQSNKAFLKLKSGQNTKIDDNIYVYFEDINIKKGLDQYGIVNQDELNFTIHFTTNNIIEDLFEIILNKESTSNVLPFRLLDDIEIIVRATSGKLDKIVMSYKFRGIILKIEPTITFESTFKNTISLSITANNVSKFDKLELVDRSSETNIVSFIDDEIIKAIEPEFDAETNFQKGSGRLRLEDFGFRAASGRFYKVGDVLAKILEYYSETKVWKIKYPSFYEIVQSYTALTKLVVLYYGFRFSHIKDNDLVKRFSRGSSIWDPDKSPLLGELLISAEEIKDCLQTSKKCSICNIIGNFFQFLFEQMGNYLEKHYPNIVKAAQLHVLQITANVDKINSSTKEVNIRLAYTKEASEGKGEFIQNLDIDKLKKFNILTDLNYSLSTDDSTISTIMLAQFRVDKTGEQQDKSLFPDKLDNERETTINKSNYKSFSDCPWGKAFPISGTLKSLMLVATPSTPFKMFNSGIKMLDGQLLWIKDVSYTFGTKWETEISFVGVLAGISDIAKQVIDEVDEQGQEAKEFDKSSFTPHIG